MGASLARWWGRSRPRAIALGRFFLAIWLYPIIAVLFRYTDRGKTLDAKILVLAPASLSRTISKMLAQQARSTYIFWSSSRLDVVKSLPYFTWKNKSSLKMKLARLFLSSVVPAGRTQLQQLHLSASKMQSRPPSARFVCTLGFREQPPPLLAPHSVDDETFYLVRDALQNEKYEKTRRDKTRFLRLSSWTNDLLQGTPKF